MEHPHIGKLDDLTTDELLQKINDLSSKLRIAASSGNGHLCNQIRMAIGSYESHYQSRISKSGGDNYETHIDIS